MGDVTVSLTLHEGEGGELRTVLIGAGRSAILIEPRAGEDGEVVLDVVAGNLNQEELSTLLLGIGETIAPAQVVDGEVVSEE